VTLGVQYRLCICPQFTLFVHRASDHASCILLTPSPLLFLASGRHNIQPCATYDNPISQPYKKQMRPDDPVTLFTRTY
jgi:hypothetical protein